MFNVWPVWLLSVWWMLYIHQEYTNDMFSESYDQELSEMVVSFAQMRGSHGSSAEVKQAQRAAKSSKNSDQVRNWKMGKGGLPKSQQLSL